MKENNNPNTKVRKPLSYFNERLKNLGSTVEIIDYEEYPDIVKCHCSQCNQTFIANKLQISYREKCPVCTKKILIVGYNNLSAMRPDLVQYLVNKEDGEKYFPQSNKKIKCKCPDCGFQKEILISKLTRQGFGCPNCSNITNQLVVGKNDILSQSKWMVSFLENPNDALKYTCNSNQRINFKCPYCNTVYNKAIYAVNRFGFHCNKCNDNISYPNKFARALFDQLCVDYIEYEFNKEWTCGKKYDVYFEKDNHKYFLEMDGGFHYESTKFSNVEDVHKNDLLKDKIAYQNNITMIRIDARNSDEEYLENNIKNSILNSIFDLSKIDWNKCDIQSQNNLFYNICDDYNLNELTLTQIAEKYHISYSTVKLYTRKGKKLGICNNTINGISRNNKIKKQYKDYIGCIKDTDKNIIYEFVDFVDANDFLGKYDTEIKISHTSLWWVATKSKSKLYKKKYYIVLY